MKDRLMKAHAPYDACQTIPSSAELALERERLVQILARLLVNDWLKSKEKDSRIKPDVPPML